MPKYPQRFGDLFIDDAPSNGGLLHLRSLEGESPRHVALLLVQLAQDVFRREGGNEARADQLEEMLEGWASDDSRRGPTPPVSNPPPPASPGCKGL